MDQGYLILRDVVPAGKLRAMRAACETPWNDKRPHGPGTESPVTLRAECTRPRVSLG